MPPHPRLHGRPDRGSQPAALIRYRGRDGHRAVAAALAADAARSDVTLAIRTASERPWASATFSGARHVLTLAASGRADAVAGWIAGLADAELALAHHVAADVTAQVGDDGTVTVEVLTVEAA